MLIIGNFLHSIELEEALGELEYNGVSRNNILIVPMDTHSNMSNQLITKSRDFASKGIEIGMACATAASVIGTSVGFALRWGPIIWGLIGAFIGFIVSFGLHFLFNKKYYGNSPKKLPQVTVIVECPKEESKKNMDIMWKYGALTVGQN